jgi:hypothetical protein
MSWKYGILAVGGLALASCNGGALAPEDIQLTGSEFVASELGLDRTVVVPGETFTATYTIRNTGSEDAELTTACTALARGVIYRDGAEAPFLGSSSGCYTAIGHHVVPAGGVIEWSWDVTAAIIVKAYPDGRPPEIGEAEPGQYVFQVEPNVIMIDGAHATLPRLSRTVVVE